MKLFQPDPRLATHLDRLLVGVSALFGLFLLAILLTFAYGRDQGIYAVVADAVLHGEHPYKDAWDFKPPMIYFVYAWARLFFGGSMVSIRILEATALLSMVAAFGFLSRSCMRDWRPGVFAGAIALLAHVALEFWDTAQPEAFGAVASAWALVCACAVRPRAWEQRLLWVASGALYAVAAFLKPPLGGGILVSLAFVCAARRAAAGGWRAYAEPALAFAAGGASVVAVTLLYFAAGGAIQDAAETFFVFAPGYTALNFRTGELARNLHRVLRELTFGFSPYVPAGVALLLAARHKTTVRSDIVLHVVGVMAVQILGIALQAKLFMYHYSATLPLTCLLAGWGLWQLWVRLHDRLLPAALTLIALGFLGNGVPVVHGTQETLWQRVPARLRLLSGHGSGDDFDKLHRLWDVDVGANRQAGAWLRQHTPAGAPLYVWGFEPMLYEFAARAPASRYIYNVPQRAVWVKREARRDLIADLRARPPSAIVVVEGDPMASVTGNDRDSAVELDDFAELRSYIEEGYRPTIRVQDLRIYVRQR